MIKDAAHATQLAEDLIADTTFHPTSGRKVGHTWIIKAKVGTLERVTVTFEIPDDVVVTDGRYHY